MKVQIKTVDELILINLDLLEFAEYESEVRMIHFYFASNGYTFVKVRDQKEAEKILDFLSKK